MKSSMGQACSDAFDEYLKELVDDRRQVHSTGSVGYDETEWERYQRGWDDGRRELLADIAEALIHDCENGVKWMNEAAAAKFAADYPTVRGVLNDKT